MNIKDEELIRQLRKVGTTNGHDNGIVAIAADRLEALTAALPHMGGTPFDFHAHLQRQRDWSGKTFGPGPRTLGVIDHIRKELIEIEADPSDISEWIDVAILALDGAWRAGYQPQEIIDAMEAKQTKNEGRQWPDWRTMPADKAIEHDRTDEAALASPEPAPEPAKDGT